MLNSGIGNPYNPATATGSLGRGIAMGVPPPDGRTELHWEFSKTSAATATLRQRLVAERMKFVDLSDDNFDHTGLNFIGGALYPEAGILPRWRTRATSLYTQNGPTPAMIGSTFKASIKNTFLANKKPRSLFRPQEYRPPVTDWYVDLDPHYTDITVTHCRELTIDWTMNRYNCANYLPQNVPIY